MARGSSPITDAEFLDLVARIEDLSPMLADAAGRIQKHVGVDPDVKQPLSYALALQGLAAKAGELARLILVQQANEEYRRNLEADLRSRSPE